MNINLKPIAESKVRQLGGDVCGVLVRKDQKLAAVDEYGRTTWLGDEALFDSIKQRADAWLGLVELLNDLTPEWRQHPGTGRESAFAAIRWLAQAASAQGGHAEETSLPPFDPNKPRDEQGLYGKFLVRRVDGSDLPGGKHHGCKYFVLDVDHDKYAAAALGTYASQCEKEYPLLAKDLRGKFGAQGGQPQPADQISLTRMCELLNGMMDGTEDKKYGLLEPWASTYLRLAERLAQPAVPEGYTPVRTLVLNWLLGETEAFEPLDGERGKYWWRKRLREALLSTTTPQADGWVSCEDRLPTEADTDSEGNVWFCWPDGDMWLAHYKKIQLPYHSEHHWKPTGLKRPQPPKQEGE